MRIFTIILLVLGVGEVWSYCGAYPEGCQTGYEEGYALTCDCIDQPECNYSTSIVRSCIEIDNLNPSIQDYNGYTFWPGTEFRGRHWNCFCL